MYIDNATYRSPNYDRRQNGSMDIEGLTIHTTEGSYPGDAEWLCSPKSRVSCHYLINRAGRIYHLVDDHQRAWHAGHYWGNNNTVGIELTHKQGQDWPRPQFTALDDLCRFLIRKYDIISSGIVAHRWLTPARKIDPTDWSDEDFHTWIDSLYGPEQELPTPQSGWHKCVWPATVRTAPQVASDNVVATFPPDTHLQVSWVQGQFVRGSDWWAHLTHSELGFIHASALQEVRW